jgi:RNA polymerase sigma factor (sigma-70 family)
MAEHALGGAVHRVTQRLTTERYRALNDRQLLERFLHQHDEPAFAALVRRHQRSVYAALNRVLSDPDDLEDAFQATFLVLVRKAPSVRWQDGLGTWLYAVAHRVAVSARVAVRTRLHHEEQAAGQAETTAAPPDLSCREACDLVHQELERLPERLRVPLLLCYLEGKSRDEAAAQLGVSIGVIKGRLERGRNLLRQRLVKRGVPLTAGLLVALAHSSARASSPYLIQATVAAVSGPSARVAALANGVSATMILNKLKLVLGLLLLAGMLGALASQLGAARPALEGPSEAKRPQAAPKAPDADVNLPANDEVTGRVLDEAGKPIAGGQLSLWSGSWGTTSTGASTGSNSTTTTLIGRDRVSKVKARSAGETGKDGRFRVKLSRDDLDRRVKLIVRTKAHGVDWLELYNRPAGEVTFRLGADVPIQGRIVDLEGQAVVGAVVTVEVVTKSVNGDLTTLINSYKNIGRGVGGGSAGGGGSGSSWSPGPLVSLPPEALALPTSVTTDKTGRFRLEGIGRERLVRLDIVARGMARQSAAVVTRPGFKKGSGPLLGPSFDLPLAPGKEVVGVVKEKDTGRPVAGSEVTLGGGRVRVHTDERGAFRLEGLTKRPMYRVWVRGPGHFGMMREAKDTAGRDPIRVEIEVQRGIHVEGRLLDGGTGKPIAGFVQYAISPENPAVNEFPFETRLGLGSEKVRPDGKFRIMAIPGPGYLAVRAAENRFARMVPEGWTGSVVASVPGQLQPHYYHATVPINLDEKKPASLKCDIRLDPGLSKSGSIVDPDGKPVSDVLVFGLTAVPETAPSFLPVRVRSHESHFRQKGSTFTVIGLGPKQPRHLVFVHPQKKLGKVLLVRGDEKGPLAVKLEPLGAVSGRIRTEEGKVEAGRRVILEPPRLLPFFKDYPIDLLLHTHTGGWGSPQVTAWLPKPTRTDEEGRFRVDGLVPGLRYALGVVTSVDVAVRLSHVHWNVTVEAGKTRDLGDLPRVKRP